MEEEEEYYFGEKVSKEILDGNKLIGLFMDYYYRDDWRNHNYWWHSADSEIWGKGTWSPAFPIGGEHFHDSWDWLMPVIQKCYKVDNENEYFNKIQGNLCILDIEATWESVVNFIKHNNK